MAPSTRVVITHEHPDHCVDLHGLYRVRYFARRPLPRLPVYCTPGVMTRLGPLEPEGDLTDVFDVHELPGTYDVGPFRLESVMLPHYVPNAGVRLTAAGLVIAYTGDTGPDPALTILGADADLFIVEATGQGHGVNVLRAREPGTPRYHLTAHEAGRWAAQARARRLMLKHFWPGTDRAASAAEARTSFGGDVLVAEEDMTVSLERTPG